MSQPENQLPTQTSEEQQFGNAPAYGAPAQPRPQDVPTEPARMNWLSRWFGVLISPGETYADINRKPTIIVPMIILVLLTATATFVFNSKMEPYMPELLPPQIRKNMERFGQTPTEEQIKQQVDQQIMISKFTPAIVAVFMPVFYLILAGIFALGMLLIQAKATFKKILSVIVWTFAGVSTISTIVFIASIMVKDEEGLRSMNLQDPTSTIPTNVGVFLGPETSPMVKSLAGSFDIFSFWIIALLAIGFAVIANSKSIKTSKTATMILVLWGIYVLGKMGIASFFG